MSDDFVRLFRSVRWSLDRWRVGDDNSIIQFFSRLFSQRMISICLSMRDFSVFLGSFLLPYHTCVVCFAAMQFNSSFSFSIRSLHAATIQRRNAIQFNSITILWFLNYYVLGCLSNGRNVESGMCTHTFNDSLFALALYDVRMCMCNIDVANVVHCARRGHIDFTSFSHWMHYLRWRLDFNSVQFIHLQLYYRSLASSKYAFRRL